MRADRVKAGCEISEGIDSFMRTVTEKIGSRKAAFFCALPAQRGFLSQRGSAASLFPHTVVGAGTRGIFLLSQKEESSPYTPKRKDEGGPSTPDIASL